MSSTARTACGSAACTGSDSPMPAPVSAGSQATTRLRPGRPPSEASRAKMSSGARLWASMTGAASGSRPGVRPALLDLEHGHRSRLGAAGGRVDQHEQVAPVEQVVGQVHAPDAEVADLHARPDRPLRRAAGPPRRRTRRRAGTRCPRPPPASARSRSRSRSWRLARLYLVGREVEEAAVGDAQVLVRDRRSARRPGKRCRRRRAGPPRPGRAVRQGTCPGRRCAALPGGA